MKYSIYNSILTLSPQSKLLYNSFSDKYLVFNRDLEDLITNNVDELNKNHNNIYELLLNGGFYVEEDVDEFHALKKMSDSIVNKDTNYFVMINPTLACNFKCWYCYENHIPDSKMTAGTIERTISLFKNVIENNSELSSFSISFFGGEPLLYFKSVVLPLMQAHSKLCEEHNLHKTLSFTSNGSLVTEFMITEMKKLYEETNFQITLDGDREKHNKVRYFGKDKGSYDIILDNIKLLISNEIGVTLRINYTSENIDSVKNIIDDLDLDEGQRKYLNVDFHQVWQDREQSSSSKILDEAVDKFYKKGFHVTSKDINMVRRPCYGDVKNTVLINYNGDVYKCTARDFSPTLRYGYLNESGNIVWENKLLEKRLNTKFQNPLCKDCRIAPLCGGGCSQFIKEQNGKNYCLYSDESSKNQVILDRFDQNIVRNHEISELSPT